MDSCCAGSPSGLAIGVSASKRLPTAPQVIAAKHEFFSVAAGPFTMGSEDLDSNIRDFEGPLRTVDLPDFEIAATPVTNRQFEDFVAATGYQTEAELAGWSFVFHLLVADSAQVIGSSDGAPWWLGVEGANWRSPQGTADGFESILEHPVVHVSYKDALAYCEWSQTRLPSESEWEKAARGGLASARYPWGNELLVDGQWQCNIFQGSFPEKNTAEDGFIGTSPVKTFPANGFGGYDFSGNVWEWTSTDFQDPATSGSGQNLKVTRGGSYLCHDSYCNRYRVGARNKTPADSLAGNIGFRVVKGKLA